MVITKTKDGNNKSIWQRNIPKSDSVFCDNAGAPDRHIDGRQHWRREMGLNCRKLSKGAAARHFFRQCQF
jgi:hypothetical protein